MATGLDQYLREYSILLNGEPFIDAADRQLRIVFDVHIKPSGSYAYADISLYNLSPDTKIQPKDDIILSAGYQNNIGQIFTGAVRNVFLERNGPDVITRITCNASNAYNRGVVSASFGEGAKLIDVLKAVAKAWPLRLQIDESQFTNDDKFTTGYTAFGDPVKVLDSLKHMFNFEWVPEQGDLVITRPNKERTTDIVEINEFTGMVGMPVISAGPQGMKVLVTARINPKIRTDSRINLTVKYATYSDQSVYLTEMQADANGEFNVLSLTYSGDLYGTDWNVQIEGLRAGSEGLPQIDGAGLIWGAKRSAEFRNKVRQVADNLGLDPNWLMAIMAFETGRSFSPSEPNKAGSGATGLIQFMPSTATGLGTTTKALANMSDVQQMDYVEKYFRPYASRINSLSDAYMAVLWPAAIGKSENHILWKQGSIQYTQNASLDKNHDGTITKSEAASRVNDMFIEGMQHKG